MSETKTVNGAVVYDAAGVPQVELSAEEFIFPILTADERWTLLFHMKPAASSYPIKRFYDLFLLRSEERGSSEIVTKMPDMGPVEKFVDEHFIRLAGVETKEGQEPSIEQQRRWLDLNVEFKHRVFREGYDGISEVKTEETPKNGHKPVLLFDVTEHRIEAQWKLYSEQKERTEKVGFVHVLGRMSQADKHQYFSAIKAVRNTRKSERHLEANWDVIEGLYDKLVQSLEGILYKGEACTAANKKTWLERVPFSMKVFAMGRCVSEIDLKNV